MRPRSIRIAGALLVLAAILAIEWDVAIASATVGLWCCSWLWSPVVVLLGLVGGAALLFLGPGPGTRSLGWAGGVACVTDIVNFDLLAFVLGLAALDHLRRTDATDWLRGEWTPPWPTTLTDGESGLVLTCEMLPLAFLLNLGRVRLDVGGRYVGELPWGTSAVSLPPGSHAVRVEVRGLILVHHPATLVVDVTPGEHVSLRYFAPGFLFFLPGWLSRR